MKSRSEIWFALLEETGRACSVSTTHDRKTVESRLAAEGDSFLTVSLPVFHKDFITSLALAEIPTDAFPGFSRRKAAVPKGGARGIPEFLGGFLDLLFTSERGRLVDGEVVKYYYPNPVLREFDLTDVHQVDRASMALKSIRQLTLMFSKEKDLCSDTNVADAIQQYVQTDKDVTLPLWIREVISSSELVSSRLLGECYVSVLEKHLRRLIERSLTER